MVRAGQGCQQDRMSWTWTGYDHDAVHRFKDEAFFQTGRKSVKEGGNLENQEAFHKTGKHYVKVGDNL